MDKRQQQQYNNKERRTTTGGERESNKVLPTFRVTTCVPSPCSGTTVCVWSRVTEKLLSIPQRMLKFTLCVASHDDPRRKACRVCKGCGGQNLLEINKID